MCESDKTHINKAYLHTFISKLNEEGYHTRSKLIKCQYNGNLNVNMLHILYDHVFHLGFIYLFVLTKLWESCEETGEHGTSVIQNRDLLITHLLKVLTLEKSIVSIPNYH